MTSSENYLIVASVLEKTGLIKDGWFMNTEMAYLLGMVCGNGEIRRGATETRISINIPHKKLKTENNQDVQVYVRASIADIRAIIEPLIGTGIEFTQAKSTTTLSFNKANTNYIMRELLRFIGNASSHENIRVNHEVYEFTRDEKIQFLRGFADVTGYIRRSNHYFNKYEHRVYLEVPHNWYLVVDICNLLKDVGVPVQNINWSHPNFRDGKLVKFDEGKPHYWKKEHQIKIYANEFRPIGFAVVHKAETLEQLSNELVETLELNGVDVTARTHKYYWEVRDSNKSRLHHPRVNDDFIPETIRGRQYNSWKDIARDLGYGE